MNHSRPSFILPALISTCALALALAFASTAAAEVRSGETSSPVDAAIPGEADIAHATASYDSVAGAVTVTVATREAPTDGSKAVVSAAVGTEQGSSYEVSTIAGPVMNLVSELGSPTAWWSARENLDESVGSEAATKSTSATTTTLGAASSTLTGKPYDCVAIGTFKEIAEEPQEYDESNLTLASPSSPPPVPMPPAPSRAAPASLSIAMSGRLRLKAGKWTKVKVEVSDNGGSATGPVTLKVRRKVGVVVKPASGKLRLPALQPGQTEAVYIELKLAGKANSKWAISLTGSAKRPTAERSIGVR